MVEIEANKALYAYTSESLLKKKCKEKSIKMFSKVMEVIKKIN